MWALGVGYSFVRSERVLFGAAVMCGSEASQYDDTDDVTVGDVEHTYKDSLLLSTASVGGDVFVRYRLGERVGLFANVGARCLIVGSLSRDHKDDWTVDGVKHSKASSDDGDLLGVFIVQPTFGIIWTF